jgi:hypothetical protein
LAFSALLAAKAWFGDTFSAAANENVNARRNIVRNFTVLYLRVRSSVMMCMIFRFQLLCAGLIASS